MLLFALFAMVVSSNDLAAKAEKAKQAMAARDFTSAVALYQALNNADPGDLPVQQNLGIALYSAGRYGESLKIFDQVLHADPDNKPGLLFSGIDLNRLDEPSRSVPALTKFLAEAGELALARLELGNAHYELGNVQAAVDDFSKACALESANPACWKGLGVAYWALEKQNFDWIEAHASFSPEWFALLALSELHQEHYQKAFQLYRQAATGSQTLLGVHRGLAEVYRKTGHPDWAFVEDGREHSAAAEGREEAGRRYISAIDDQRRATEALDRLQKLVPGSEVHELLGFAYRAQHRDTESAAEFHEAMAIEPENIGLKREWATSLWLSGDCLQAEPILEQLLRSSPNSPRLNHLLGDCLVQDKRPQKALAYLRTALKLDPAFLPAAASIGRAYMHLGRCSEAIPYLKNAVALHDKATLFQLAQAYKKLGDEAAASRYVEEYKRYDRSMGRSSQLPDEVEITPP